MGTTISVPLGTVVLAYNDTGKIQYTGSQLTGDKLKPSYVPGSLPWGYTYYATHLFECLSYCPERTTSTWVRIA